MGELIADWIDRNPVGVGDGWHPYTLSRRIPNWIYALWLTGLAFGALLLMGYMASERLLA